VLRLALAKALRDEASEHRRDELRRLDRWLRSLTRENFGIGDEIAMKRRRQLDRQLDRLVVLDRAELELRHFLPLQPA
jgi:hypothetical protein